MQCTNSTHNLGAAHRQTTRTPHAQGFSFSHTGSRYANALTRDGRGRIHAPPPTLCTPPFQTFPFTTLHGQRRGALTTLHFGT